MKNSTNSKKWQKNNTKNSKSNTNIFGRSKAARVGFSTVGGPKAAAKHKQQQKQEQRDPKGGEWANPIKVEGQMGARKGGGPEGWGQKE